MGYDLHITRRRQWSDTGADIRQAEWLATIDSDGELWPAPEIGPAAAWWRPSGADDHLWLAWTDGIVTTKNPPPALIDKMVAIARGLHAIVQGDDGERYESSQQPPIPYRPSLTERLASVASRVRRAPAVQPAPLPPFGIGDAVKDVFGRAATVVALDPLANHGLGSIVLRYENGREAKLAMIAHHLSAIPKS